MYHKEDILLLALLIWRLSLIHSANWAQSSGKIDQNVVIPYYPRPSNRHWQARYGMAVVVVTDPSSVELEGVAKPGYVYLMGGDTYDGRESAKNVDPGLLDLSWYNGLKNDVWRMDGTVWSMRGDPRLQQAHGQKIPSVRSNLKWDLREKGKFPAKGQTYDDWIICEEFFNNNQYALQRQASCKGRRSVMWSPRRHHAALFFKGFIYVMGGRAREFVDLPHERSVGGIIGPHIEDVQNINQKFTTQREAVVVKNDVWRSADGVTWGLVTPGCKRPQLELLAGGNPKEGKKGRAKDECRQDSDCYGAEKCGLSNVRFTCVCPMWSGREQHAVSAFGDWMYVMGGYASRLFDQLSNCGPFACGDTDASAYRYYMADLWKSSDGARWEQVLSYGFPVNVNNLALNPDGLGRGGHQMLAFADLYGNPYLWIFGGKGADNQGLGRVKFYNDVWKAPIAADGSGRTTLFEQVSVSGSTEMPWAGRAGHTATLETATAHNGKLRSIFIVGGAISDNNTADSFLDDVWGWRPDIAGDVWRKDFAYEGLFGSGDGTEYRYVNNSPAVHYISPDSDLGYLQRYRVPTKLNSKLGKRLEMRPYLTTSRLKMLNEAGLKTIRDLANADKYTILRLRGYDFPQVAIEDRFTFGDICDARALAIAVVDKCSVSGPSLYDGAKNMPWRQVPAFGGPPPKGKIIEWHALRNYNMLLPGDDDPKILTENWDGCAYNEKIQGLHGPNVDGIGHVSQINKIRDPTPELQNLFCKQVPGPRAYHAALLFEERVYLFGGKSSEVDFNADTWYRDARMPTARFKIKPPSYSPFPTFEFYADEAGVTFEYRIWDPYNYKEIREWTPVVRKTDIGWLSWRFAGPSDGLYTIYVRAVDPAGNRDERFVLDRNVYTWYYVSPTPWDIIAEVVCSFIGLCIIGYMEYRRRVKKAAMERYAMKRMRRKFKAMQRDIDGRAMDWRTLYLESKEQDDIDAKRRKGNKKQRDKKREQREKDKKKRDKEKERIKKKLKAGKDFKQKSKKDNAGADQIADKSKSKKKKKKRGDAIEDGDEDGGGQIEGGEVDDYANELQGILGSSGGVDAKKDKEKAKAKLMGDKKYKEYEDELAAHNAALEDAPLPLQEKKFKDYEREQAVAPAADDANNELEKEGAKQRRTNKRYKDYEAGGDPDNRNDKKDK